MSQCQALDMAAPYRSAAVSSRGRGPSGRVQGLAPDMAAADVPQSADRVAPLADERVLTTRELNRALLARQLLLERRSHSVQRAVERLCALQAQYSPSPYIALWSRLTGFRKDALTRALERRLVVRATLMRITLHLVSARDYPYFAAIWMPATQEMTAKVTAKQLARLATRVQALARDPTTHAEIEAVAATQMGGRWRTRCLAPLVHLPPSGTWRFHGRPQLQVMEEYLGVELPPREAGAEQLVRSYLSAFGPATQTDILRFAGMRVGDVRPGIERLPLRTFRDESGRVLLDLPRAPLPDPVTDAPARFLPKWDHALLAYDDRSRILPKELQSTVIRKNGDVLPTFLVDGTVAGMWNVERKGHRATLRLEPFAPLPRRARDEVAAEGERLMRWIEDDATSFAVR
jgi:Winged helix DNA-binding domain